MIHVPPASPRAPNPFTPLFSLGLLAVSITAGCSSPARGPSFNPRDPDDPTIVRSLSVTNVIHPEWLQPPSNEYRLGPGDRIEIELIGFGDPPTDTIVGPDGRIYFHLVPGISVWGKTPSETCKALEAELARYVRHPRVTLSVRQVVSQRVWVLGRLQRPGIYPIQRPTTLIDAITQAGGLYTARFTGTTEELADLQHSFIVRNGEFLPVNFKSLIHEGDLSQNIYLQPDDFVFLPSALSTGVYVLGAVFDPRAVSFKDQVTVSSAIAAARGTLPEAHLREVVIVRGSLSNPHCAIVNFQDIIRGRIPDVPLQPRDIVYVPDKPLGTLRNAGMFIVNTFVRTVAANEGIRAAGGVDQIGVGVNVGP
jgi:protein involved in polysaccharide export with SLBB domain